MNRHLEKKGSTLIILIAMIAVMLSLGAAVVYLRATSSHTQTNANTGYRAYYLAEFGKRYADFPNANWTGSKTFRLSDGDEIRIDIDSTGYVSSTSTFFKNSSLESVRSIGGQKKFGMPCWNFDDPNPKADSCGSNPISVPVTTADGRFGKALRCDGITGIETSFEPLDEIGNGKPFSVSFWAKPDNTTGDQVIFGTSDGTSPPRRFSVGISGGNWFWAYGDTIRITPIPADTRWQKVTMIYTGTSASNQITLYVGSYDCTNPLQSDTASVANALLPTTAKNLFVCGEHGTGLPPVSSLFAGRVDELRIYDRVLKAPPDTPNEIIPPCDAGCDASAYYPFTGNTDDKSGPTQSGNGNNATAFGTPVSVSDRFGCAGRAYGFSGSSYVSANDNNSLDLTTAGTVSAWIRVDTFLPKAGIIHKGDNVNFGDSAYSLQFWWGTGREKKIMLALNAADTLTSTFDLLANRWYHIAGSWDNTGMKLYIDGTLNSSNSVSNISVRNSDAHLHIGAQLDADKHVVDTSVIPNIDYGNCPFVGDIDEVLLFDRALSDYEIAALAADRP